jgi:hypothetical protein
MKKLRPQEVDVLSYPDGAHMTSSTSKTRYCVMFLLSKCVIFLLSKFVMLFWDNLIYGNVMLYMSLGLVVLLLL